FLYDQLLQSESKIAHRKKLSGWYHEALQKILKKGAFSIMPDEQVENNIHAYYILLQNHQKRNELQHFLAQKNIEAFFHYTPLHKSPMGKMLGKTTTCSITEKVANSLLRLPFHDEINQEDVVGIVDLIQEF